MYSQWELLSTNQIAGVDGFQHVQFTAKVDRVAIQCTSDELEPHGLFEAKPVSHSCVHAFKVHA
jgi:hypothetical protein